VVFADWLASMPVNFQIFIGIAGNEMKIRWFET
jgi:hypothetical protein